MSALVLLCAASNADAFVIFEISLGFSHSTERGQATGRKKEAPRVKRETREEWEAERQAEERRVDPERKEVERKKEEHQRWEDRARARANGAREKSQCLGDDDCFGWCREGRCVDTGPVRPIDRGESINCVDSQSCRAGQECRDHQCVELEPGPGAPLQRCSPEERCEQGQTCTNGQCLSAPPSPPLESTQWQRGYELFLRQRAVQLRQDLALGEGPVLSSLAALQGVSALALGRVLRAHRAELLELVGDGTDESWPARFLCQVEVLRREV